MEFEEDDALATHTHTHKGTHTHTHTHTHRKHSYRNGDICRNKGDSLYVVLVLLKGGFFYVVLQLLTGGFLHVHTYTHDILWFFHLEEADT
jgi:hypothetical protein